MRAEVEAVRAAIGVAREVGQSNLRAVPRELGARVVSVKRTVDHLVGLDALCRCRLDRRMLVELIEAISAVRHLLLLLPLVCLALAYLDLIDDVIDL